MCLNICAAWSSSYIRMYIVQFVQWYCVLWAGYVVWYCYCVLCMVDNPIGQCVLGISCSISCIGFCALGTGSCPEGKSNNHAALIKEFRQGFERGCNQSKTSGVKIRENTAPVWRTASNPDTSALS